MSLPSQKDARGTSNEQMQDQDLAGARQLESSMRAKL